MTRYVIGGPETLYLGNGSSELGVFGRIQTLHSLTVDLKN